MNYAFEEMKSIGDEYLKKEAVSVKDRYYHRSLDMRYKGQYHELEVPLTADLGKASSSAVDEHIIEDLVEQFHQMHESLYSYRGHTEIEILNLRLSAFGKVHTPTINEQPFVQPEFGKPQEGLPGTHSFRKLAVSLPHPSLTANPWKWKRGGRPGHRGTENHNHRGSSKGKPGGNTLRQFSGGTGLTFQ